MVTEEQTIISKIFEDWQVRQRILEDHGWFYDGSYKNLKLSSTKFLWLAVNYEPPEIEYVDWYKGDLYDVEIESAIVYGGKLLFVTWKNGKFIDGVFESSTWENGIFEGGLFKSSLWLSGTWRGGKWGTKNEIFDRYQKKYRKSKLPPNECEWSWSYKK